MNKELFGKLPDGREVYAYTLKNESGMKMTVITYGCRIISLFVPDKGDKEADVILGHKTLEEYYDDYHGSFVGRYANRIGGAEFSLNGETYRLDKNDGANTLHGGARGFHQVVFDVSDVSDSSISFSYVSPDMEENYPGNLDVVVKYTLTDENELAIEYTADTDKETVYNPTNHSFFNLSGDHQKEIYDTELQIFADYTTEVTADLIPTGELLSVKGTALDFSQPKLIGKDISSSDPTVAPNNGYDNNYCVEGDGYHLMARAKEPQSGITLETYSDLPGVQLYTFNSTPEGTKNKDGSAMKPHTAFCLETQFYPNSPNVPSFPFVTVKPKEGFVSRTVYKFGVEKR